MTDLAVDKAQWVRLLDVFLLGPGMIYYGQRLTSPTGRLFLTVTGIGTIAYNGLNYLANQRLQALPAPSNLQANVLDWIKDTSKDIALEQAKHTAILLKTNLGPEIEIDPFSTSPSLLDSLGVQFAVTLKDRRTGEVLYQSAPPPETDRLKVGLILGGVLGVAALIVRGIAK